MTDIASPTKKTFRVRIVEWTCYRVYIEADSKEEAEAKAEEMWDAGDAEGFDIHDNGLDDFEVDEIPK